jgi:PAS domain S-box-containing protein
MTITPHHDTHQQVDYLICSGWDITKHKHAEEQLLTLIDAIPQLVWIARPDGFPEYHSRRWCDYTGLSNEQSQGTEWLQAIHPDDRQETKAAWQKAIQTGIPYEREHRFRNGTTGEYRWFLVQGVPQRDAKGAIVKWFGTCTDIDNQKRAEQRLKAGEENLRVLAEMMPQFVWITRADGFLEYWNQQYANYFQATPEQLQGYGWRQFLHPEDHDRVIPVRRHTLVIVSLLWRQRIGGKFLLNGELLSEAEQFLPSLSSCAKSSG